MKKLWAIGFGTLLAFGCSSSPSTNDGGADGAADVKVDHHAETGGGNEAATCGSGLACELCDGSFSTSQMFPPYAAAGVCTPTDITAFVTACGNASSQTDCDAWQTAESTSAPDCLSCAFSALAGPKWGVYVCDSNGCFFNTGGCLDVALTQVSQEKQAGGAGSCGDLINDAFRCEDYACNTCTTQNDFNACVTSADTNECKTYSDLANGATGPCAPLNDASATVNSCFGQTDADLNTMTTLLCGAGT